MKECSPFAAVASDFPAGATQAGLDKDRRSRRSPRIRVARHSNRQGDDAIEGQWSKNIANLIKQVSSFAIELPTCDTSDDIFRVLDRYLQDFPNVQDVASYVYDSKANTLRQEYRRNQPFDNGRNLEDVQNLTHPITRCARTKKRVCTEREIAASIDVRATQSVISLHSVYLPLVVSAATIHVVAIEFTSGLISTLEAFDLFGIYVSCTALALKAIKAKGELLQIDQELQRANEERREIAKECHQMQEASLTDPLTGLRNRRFLQQNIDSDVRLCLRKYEEWQRNKSSGPLVNADIAFFMIDIDHFKAINDTHGHAAGDQVLIQFQERLSEIARDSDYVIRWGGEEFLHVARETDRRNCARIAQRICTAISSRNFELPSGISISVTCSVGFSCFPHLANAPRSGTWCDTIECADRQLYQAKQKGRNRWEGIE